MLSALIWIPILGAAVIGFWPGVIAPNISRKISLAIAGTAFLWSVFLAIQFDPSVGGLQFSEFGHLTKSKVNALIYNCDCYVSLHRAEGFGLTMAEAMFYGKPVIATGYSSNTDFMNVGNSFLVKYELVTTTEEYFPYPKGSIWAEPDIDCAASLMQYVFQNYREAQKVGVRASEDIKSLLSPHSVGIKIRNRLEHIMRKIHPSALSTQLEEIKAEINWRDSQLKAWRQTAEQAQIELEECRRQIFLKQSQM